MLEFIKQFLVGILQFIKDCIKDALLKLALFVVLVILMLSASGVTRAVLGKLNYDEVSKRQIGDRVGHYVAVTGTTVAAIVAAIFWLRQAKRKSEAGRQRPSSPVSPLYPKEERRVPPRCE